MIVNTDNFIYLFLRQDGPFATCDRPSGGELFSSWNRQHTGRLRAEKLHAKYRVARDLIFQFLDVRFFTDIQLLIKDPRKLQEVNRRVYTLLGNMFAIKGNEREIIARVNNYSRTADGVIRLLKSKVLADYSSNIEMTNEIDATSNPVTLLLIMFNERYHKKARFEAKRKLLLMQLAASIDQRERETDSDAKFLRFLDFLNDYVWSENTQIGELESVYLLSSHDPQTFTCTGVKILDREEAEKVEPKPGCKLTLLKRRRFRAAGHEIPIHVSIRKKPPEAKVLKLLRKGEENPAVAVDDDLGLMAVVDSMKEVKIFLKHLTQSAIRADSFMTLEEISDTLAGGYHESGNAGSSPKTPMFKFFARMSGMRVEFIAHTNASYLNYIYERDVSHDEYEARRVFDSGVAELLFPKDIYHLDMKRTKEEVIHRIREKIEQF